MKKKILKILLIFFMVLCFSNRNVEAYSNNKLYSDIGTNVDVGETVEIPIYISESQSLMGLGLDVKYDSTRLEAISVDGSNLQSYGMLDNSIGTKYQNPFRIIWSNSQAINISGRIVTIKFKVIGGGYADINVSVRSNDTFDGEYKNVNIDSCNIKLNCLCNHKYTESNDYKKATLSTDGMAVHICEICGNKVNETIKKISKVSLSKTSFVYGSNNNTPNVIVYDSNGKVISRSNYTVQYAKSTKSIGRYNVRITFVGNKYSGIVTKEYEVIPKAAKLKIDKKNKKKVIVSWNKVKQVSGYQIQTSSSKKMKKAKNTYINSGKRKKATISAKGKKRLYIRIRTYKIVKINSKRVKIYSKWSKRVKAK